MKNSNKGTHFQRIIDTLHKNIIIIIIVIVVLAGIISTFTIVRGDHKVEEAIEPELKTMNTVYFAMDQVQSLNPLTSVDSDTFYISQLLYSSLFKLDDHLNITGDLVKSYTTKPSEGSVSIKLKENAKFSDGSKLTASDVSYTVNMILGIGESCPYFSYVNKIDTVQVTGERSLKITFESPSDAALDNLVFPIVSRTDYSTSSIRTVGSGQYCISSYNSEKSLKLKPNKYYFGDKAENRIQFKVVTSKARVTGLMTMEAVTAYVSREQDADAEAEDRNLLVTQIPSCELEYLGFNFKNIHLAKKDVRHAVAMAIDTKGLINDNYAGAAIQSDSIYYPGFLGSENQGDAYDYDIKGALDLLKAAGYDDRDEDGILEDEYRRNMSLTLVVNSKGSRPDTAESIGEVLKELGIDVKIKVLDWEEYKEALAEQEYDLYIGGYKLDKKSDLRMMFQRASKAGFSNNKIIDCVNQLETSLSAKKQSEVFAELKPLLTEELPYYCLCYKAYSFITVDKFRGEEIPVFFDIYRGCSTWEWDKTITPAPAEEERE